LKIPPFDEFSSSLSDLGVEDRVVSEVEPPPAGVRGLVHRKETNSWKR
jgi:hypothetical protein